jgi:hypothetical protein
MFAEALLPDELRCQSCDSVIGRFTAGRLKIHVRSRLIAVRKSGQAEITCHHCKTSTDLPLRFNLSLDTP